ncbi:MAG: CoA pyrophosphatase, partial [Pseudomonadota bacterium]
MTHSYKLDWLDTMAGLSQAFDVPAAAVADPLQPRLASVMVPVFWRRDEWHLLFIRRVVNERDRHSGQVAFPGGRKDPGDADAVATATREAFEEIGLPVTRADVLLTLDDYLTSSHYQVTPVVAQVPWPYDASSVVRILAPNSFTYSSINGSSTNVSTPSS